GDPRPRGQFQRLQFPQVHFAPAIVEDDVRVYRIHRLTTLRCQQLISVGKVDYNMPMPRPRKDGRLRMDTDLRIPVTSEQKALIQEATSDEPEGMAAWARAILLQAAREKIARRKLDEDRGRIEVA